MTCFAHEQNYTQVEQLYFLSTLKLII